MIVIGIEGPSYAGKSTLVKAIALRCKNIGLKCLIFNCYMEAMSSVERKEVPLTADLTIDEQLSNLKIFLNIEEQRMKLIMQSSNVDLVVLDRTILTLFAHNYILSKLTQLPFYEQLSQVINENYDKVVHPDFYILVDTPHSILKNRYPVDDQTLFTKTLYNDHFNEYFYKYTVKDSLTVSLSDNSALKNAVELIINKVTTS